MNTQNVLFFLILSCFISYLIGSFPTAYLIVKKKFGKDLRKEGSGNVGTLNAFIVSKSKALGAAVLIIDFLKGAVPVYLLIYIFNKDASTVFASSIFLIVGHNYPVWLKFKGGRGLALAAGIFSVINYLLLFTWCIIWLMYFFLVKKDVLAANFSATLLYPFLAWAFKQIYFGAIHPLLLINEYYVFLIFSFAVSFVILSKHIEVLSPLMPSLQKSKTKT